MKSTSKFDNKGLEVFEGDKVLKAWGWFNWEGLIRTQFKIHTIIIRDAFLMGNGEMRDDGDGKVFCLGNCYNSWKGSEVRKLTSEEINEIGISEDTSFFFNEDGKAVKVTDKHFMQLSDEDWKKELERRNRFEYRIFFSDSKINKIK